MISYKWFGAIIEWFALYQVSLSAQFYVDTYIKDEKFSP
jgi:hypothetical protein